MNSVGDATVEFLAQALKPIEEDIPLIPGRRASRRGRGGEDATNGEGLSTLYVWYW
jgi:hypothetical protein